MESYRTEEEQLDALKKWWDENGRSTVFAVVLALGAGLGWNQWQGYRQSQAEQASVAYEEMLTAIREAAQDDDAERIKTLAERIKTDYRSSTYAQFASMHLARVAAAEGDLAAAEAELRWVLTQDPAPEIALVAELRLARVKTSLGQPGEALDILTAAEPGAYAAAYAEAEGDAWQALGDTDKAIAAYEKSLSLAAASGIGASEALRLKLGALTPVPARELATVSEE